MSPTIKNLITLEFHICMSAVFLQERKWDVVDWIFWRIIQVVFTDPVNISAGCISTKCTIVNHPDGGTVPKCVGEIKTILPVSQLMVPRFYSSTFS